MADPPFTPPQPPETSRPTPTAIALLFLRLGLTAFGGPAAHIAMMQQEVVERRRWVRREEFLDLLGAANLIPGPSSTELAIFIGYRLAGGLGLALAGLCFVMPAFALVLGLAWAYVEFGRLPQLGWALFGVKPVVIAIVVQALWRLGRTALKTRALAALSAAALVPALLGASPLVLLLCAGAVTGGRQCVQERKFGRLWQLIGLVAVLVLITLTPLVLRAPTVPPPTFSLGALFWQFLKLGSVVYGSGYVLLAFLRVDLVVHNRWLTQAQLLDAVAIGQVTPGPVFTTATFIGFVLGGPAGAVVATVAIFLPAFLFVALAGPVTRRLRSSAVAGACLDGVNVASVVLMAAVTWQLSRAALVDPLTLVIAAASLFALIKFNVNATWLIVAGIGAGIVSGWLHVYHP